MKSIACFSFFLLCDGLFKTVGLQTRSSANISVKSLLLGINYNSEITRYLKIDIIKAVIEHTSVLLNRLCGSTPLNWASDVPRHRAVQMGTCLL